MPDLSHVRRVGVFGGTFDPVHIGHLIIAMELHEALALDQVLFVPAGMPPHKVALPVTPDRDRLAMLDLALAGNPTFAISTADIERGGPSYTSELLAVLTEQLPGDRLFFLMGDDSLRDLPNWHEPARIVQLAELGVAMRPDTDADFAAIFRAVPGARERTHVVATTKIGISSSGIRRRVQAGRTIRYQVPEAVESYIIANGLYRPAE